MSAIALPAALVGLGVGVGAAVCVSALRLGAPPSVAVSPPAPVPASPAPSFFVFAPTFASPAPAATPPADPAARPAPEPPARPAVPGYDAPLADHARVLEVLGRDEWSAMAAPQARGVVAAWRANELQVSRDGGRSFESVLEGHNARAVHVAIDADGVVYAFLDSRYLAVAAPSSRGGTDLALRELPAHGSYSIYAMAAGARTLAIAANRPGPDGARGDDVLLLSTDRGATFRTVEVMPMGNAGFQLRVGDDGRVLVMTASEAACGGGSQSRYELAKDGTWRDLVWPLDTAGWRLASDGWTYVAGCDPDDIVDPAAGDADAEPPALCAVAPTRAPRSDRRGDEAALLAAAERAAIRRIRLPSSLADELAQSYLPMQVARGGGTTAVILGKHLFRGRAGSLRVAAADVHEALRDLSVDAAGHPVGVVHGYVVRWSEKGGWRVLLPR